jgi:hypothetical protein
MLKSRKKLKTCSNKDLRSVYLKPDYSLKQRQLRQKLNAEREQREVDGHGKFVIKNWRLVPATERRPPVEKKQ